MRLILSPEDRAGEFDARAGTTVTALFQGEA
jgi:hypothetical protein